MIRLDYRDARPIYEQVRDGLRSLMVTGVLAAGEKLPSVRSLATELAINPNTIQRAYSQLETEGYVYTVSGRGTFVCEVREQNRHFWVLHEPFHHYQPMQYFRRRHRYCGHLHGRYPESHHQ